MTERWLNFEELKELTGWSERAVQRKAKAGELKWRSARGSRANGRAVREYSSLSLSIDLQLELNRRAAALVVAHPVEAKTQNAQLIVLRRENISKDAPLLAVTAAQKEQIASRLAIIQPVIEYAQLSTAAERRLWCLQNSRNVESMEGLVKQIAVEQGVGRTTIWNWFGAFKRGGENELFDRFRSDKGQSRWFARHREAAELAAYLYLGEKQSVSFVADQIEHDAGMFGITEGDIPSRETVRVFLRDSISPAMKMLAREGVRKYRECMAPYLKRGYSDVYANQIWVGDHMIHDIEIQNDVFEEVPLGTPGRLRLSAFVDYRSRKAWGTWAWEGSSRSIAATLVRGMLEVGPPEHIYVDNGKDYKKVARGAVRTSESFKILDDESAPADWWQSEYDAIEKKGLLARLEITVTHCIRHHPQSKHAERFFRTLHERFDKAHSTYTSGSPFTRPEATEDAMMKHRWLMRKGRVAESKHPLASRVIMGCLRWIDEYNNTEHTGCGMDGRTPNEVFEAERNPNQRPTPEPRELALLMCTIVKRTVHESAVRIQNHRYMPRTEDLAGWAAMHEANEAGEILVGYNPTDPEFAVAIDKDGRFLAWLEAEALVRFAPWDKATQKQIGDSMEIRRGLEKATKTTLSAIAGAARANGARSAEEMLYERLELPAAVGDNITQRRPQLRPETRPAAPLTPAQVAREIAKMK